MALFMIESFGLSQRRAAGLLEASRTLLSYKPKANELNDKLRLRIKELAAKFRRWGHPKLYVVIRREGYAVNHKRTERLYRQEGLSLKIRKRKKLASVTRVKLPEAVCPNQTWAMDFVHDAFWSGRRFKALTLVDTFSKECLSIEVDTSLNGHRVVRVLNALAESRGLPESIRVDNGPEFISKVLDAWAYGKGVKLDFIRPGKPTDNGYIESFNGKFRDECLNENYFLDLHEAKEVIESWRIQYNTLRPHDSLDGLTPEEFMKNQQPNNQELYLRVV